MTKRSNLMIASAISRYPRGIEWLMENLESGMPTRTLVFYRHHRLSLLAIVRSTRSLDLYCLRCVISKLQTSNRSLANRLGRSWTSARSDHGCPGGNATEAQALCYFKLAAQRTIFTNGYLHQNRPENLKANCANS
jgi:hypothetical protein